jgi:hypothetical protein
MLYCYFASTGAIATFCDYEAYSAAELGEWQATKTYIIEQRFRFHRRIAVADGFCGTMRVLRFRQRAHMCLAVVSFDFADGACTGILKAALVK